MSEQAYWPVQKRHAANNQSRNSPEQIAVRHASRRKEDLRAAAAGWVTVTARQ